MLSTSVTLHASSASKFESELTNGLGCEVCHKKQDLSSLTRTTTGRELNFIRSIRTSLGDESAFSFEKLVTLHSSRSKMTLTALPVSLVRAICQQLTHADIEQCRLVSKDWRTVFGAASVTDMYLAMCADSARADQLTSSFAAAYPNFHHLHFWVPGGPVRQKMGTNGSTYQQYMDLFSRLNIRALTAHYMDDVICPVSGITRLRGLNKLELVDLMPACTSLACLSALPALRHLIVEYKDGYVGPDLTSIGQLTALKHLELSLHSSFAQSAVMLMLAPPTIYHPERIRMLSRQERFSSSATSPLQSQLSAAQEEWVLSMLADCIATPLTNAPSHILEGVPTLSTLYDILIALQPSPPYSTSCTLSNPSVAVCSSTVANHDPSHLEPSVELYNYGHLLSSPLPSDTELPDIVSDVVGVGSPCETFQSCRSTHEDFRCGAFDHGEQEYEDGSNEGLSTERCELSFRSSSADFVCMTRKDNVGAEGVNTPERCEGIRWQASSSGSTPITCSSSGSSNADRSDEDCHPSRPIEDHITNLLDSRSFQYDVQDPEKCGRRNNVAARGEEADAVSGVRRGVQGSIQDISCHVINVPQSLPASATTSCSGVSESTGSSSSSSGGVSRNVPHATAPTNSSSLELSPSPFNDEACPMSSSTIPVTPKPATFTASVSDILLSHICVSWKGLINLRRLEVRCVPVALAQRHLLLYRYLPGLTELKLTGTDGRLKDVYGPAQSSSKVEVNRDPSTLTLAPANLTLALHCDSATSTKAAVQKLITLTAAAAVAPPHLLPAPLPQSNSFISPKDPSGEKPYVSQSSVATCTSCTSVGTSKACAAAPSLSHSATVPLVPSAALGSSRQGPQPSHLATDIPASSNDPLSTSQPSIQIAPLISTNTPLAPPPLTAAEQREHQALIRLHPALGILEGTHTARLSSLRLYLDNPDFTALKPLAKLTHLQELSLIVCFTSDDSGSDWEDGIQLDVGVNEDMEANIVLNVMQQQQQQQQQHSHVLDSGISATAPAGAAPQASEGTETITTQVSLSFQPAPAEDEQHFGSEAMSLSQAEESTSEVQHTAEAALLPSALTSPTSNPMVFPVPSTATNVQPVALAAPFPSHLSTPDPPSHSTLHEFGSKHVISLIRSLALASPSNNLALTHLSVREEIQVSNSNADGALLSHDSCSLGPAGIQILSQHLKQLVHLDWQGLILAPHPSSLSALSSVSTLRSLTLSVNQDDPVARLGLHCLPSTLTSLTLQNLSVVPSPMGSTSTMPSLCHLHLKSCSLPDLTIFSKAPTLEWLSMDNCDTAVYAPDLAMLWPSLSWLEITYTHQDWRLLHSSLDLASLSHLTRLRKLSLVTPYEELLSVEGLLALTQLRLLSLSPSPSMARYEQLMRLSDFRFLAGLEVKLYSDVPHHDLLVEVAGAVHADMQEGLPMTDVLIMIDDSYADDPSAS
ncbi:hypothetical protein CEUSTIGMA_g13009.t1 [Chlamydomonas eustigma]|uniref:F-box domain-containing protein n=1 Tax=Chlamydomonas eustigma TaxID=1157962 RepID=A0A250XRB3_9CHLO|nr:hypothetical protein CEUSTIGMA_g13009.t1 [Chlamydomonas eustigma]|eukprot:GAX85594.1 hypothetical protein CEUSTIGMA_g13009.t1 [Chlamydomonas eustigma]